MRRTLAPTQHEVHATSSFELRSLSVTVIICRDLLLSDQHGDTPLVHDFCFMVGRITAGHVATLATTRALSNDR